MVKTSNSVITGEHRETRNPGFYITIVAVLLDSRFRGNGASSPIQLADIYSQLGREAEARAKVAEVLRINPKFSREVHKQRVPIKDPVMLERHITALRKAGLK